MGTPAGSGTPAASAAQTGGKTFPADTDPGSIMPASGVASTQVLIGSPVQPELRQVTPVASMGEGYREADGSDPS